MRIRDAVAADAAAMSGLADQLGYRASAGDIAGRLAGAIAVVAELDGPGGSGAIAGWMQLEERTLLAAGPIAEVAALVVDRDHRGEGIGIALLEWAEDWAIRRNLGAVRIRCNTVRAETHMFYRRRGYRELKTQTVFAKDLDRGGPPPRRRP